MKKQGSLKNSFYRPDWGRIVKALSFILLLTAVLCVPTKESQAQTAPGAPRTQCADLLQRARQAISEGKLADAETLIGQAESLNVQYEPLYTGDTPARLRRELERVKGVSASSQPQDPFAIRGQNSATPSVPSQSPVTNASALAKKYLAEGRSSLNLGAFDRAEQLCSEAMKLKVAYAPGEDNPDRLMRDIQVAKQQQQMAMTPPPVPTMPNMPPAPEAKTAPVAPAMATMAAPASGDVPVAVRQQSDKLLLEARKILATGDVASARAKVAQARQLNVPYGPKNDSPSRVEKDINAHEAAYASVKNNPSDMSSRKEFARVLLSQANTLYQLRCYDIAENVAMNAARLNVEYSAYDVKPQDMINKINGARQRAASGASVANASYVSNQDATGVKQVAALQPGQPSTMTEGMNYFLQGEEALKAGNTDAAASAFLKAAQHRDELDYSSQRQLNDRLTYLRANTAPAPVPGSADAVAAEATEEQNALFGKVASELTAQEAKARTLRKTNPREAVAILTAARENVDKSALDDTRKARLLAHVDQMINELNLYITQNGALIANEENNRKIDEDNARAMQYKTEKEQKIAKLIDEVGQLTREQRYAEAELKAKQAYELDPNNQACILAFQMTKTRRRVDDGLKIREMQREGNLNTWAGIEKAAVNPLGPDENLIYPDRATWADITKRRAKGDEQSPYTERELEIKKKLEQPVRLDYKQTPISAILDDLAALSGVNIYKDPAGFAAAGVASDTPVTISLTNDIQLKNALDLILEPYDLTYVIKNEVLKITSKENGRGQLYTKTYSVADLVIPIPNFVPTDNLGLSGAYRQALALNNGVGGNGIGSSIMAPATAVASRANGNVNNNILAQSMGGDLTAGSPMTPASGTTGPFGSGSGADFDSLIELITKTVEPESWKDSGQGEGTIEKFETNLSLVIRQTQEIHEHIAELLEQLRRLQDLQVTIEVRFISLSDSFYERVGVDFDVNIKSNQSGNVTIEKTTATDADGNLTETDYAKFQRSATIGLKAPGLFSSTLDIPVSQGSYGGTTPQFGGYTGGDGLSMGLAFLSDIEAYLFIEAAQADSRSNIMQAPKVTLFNGQQAMVSDTQQSPFVISVTPVVGDFAAAQQPVIVVLSEGTFLTVQAVVSNDRRFVRLTVVPFFSEIKEVNVFKFTGSTTTTEDTSSEGDDEQPITKKNSKNVSTSNSGTSVQLPTFAYQTVTTTVSVPDGGTVLLGGIKRLKEGRDEKGVPILNKIPYINRLFQNTGIGRETESLMMMVTPRIIIQEEEEERMGIAAP
ncbi:MAG: hypothetical protein IJQ39_12025 [Thermoguttaceae bacterium]|nr:hypothetical protein [Thermoguttaceae bacterium]